MKTILNLSREEKVKLVREVMENYPEASTGNSLKCIRYDYEKMQFDFVDSEKNELHHVNKRSLVKGLDAFDSDKFYHKKQKRVDGNG